MELQDLVVIVTGASRGIGRQIAIEVGSRGAKVALVARTVEARRTLPGTLAETRRVIEDAGGTALVVQCDVAEPADVERLVATVIETFGGLDVVVNNAADMVGGDFEKLVEAMLGTTAVDDQHGARERDPYENWLRQFATNVHGPYLLMTLAAPHLRARGGGVILNITSEAADLIPFETALGKPRMNPSLGYAVTKAALNRLTNFAAVDLAGDNIAVVAVDPGVVQTEVADLFSEAGMRAGGGAPVTVPAAAVLEILTADDPMVYSGRIVRAGSDETARLTP